MRFGFPRRPERNAWCTTRVALARSVVWPLEPFEPAGTGAKPSHASRDLERCDHVRPRQRAGSAVQRRLGAQAPLQLRPREGRQSDRLPEDLQARGEARPRQGDRQGLRVRQGRVRVHDRRGLRRGAGRGLQGDRHHRLRALRADRSDLLRPHLPGRAAGGSREGLLAPRPRDGGLRARRNREVRHARPPVPGRAACARGSDHARAAPLRGRDPAGGGRQAKACAGRETGARDGAAADRELLRASGSRRSTRTPTGTR